MIKRVFSAGLRALVMGLMVALPALILPQGSPDTSVMLMLAALLAAMLTMTEYASSTPSLIEFRSAPPFNRIRVLVLFAMLLSLSLYMRDAVMPGPSMGAVAAFGHQIGQALDLPFSPVRLVALSGAAIQTGVEASDIRALAGLSLSIALVALVVFVPLIRIMRWPIRKGAFNVWINLPLFDPTAGGDVIYRLKRDANVNVALGFLLPFLIPALMKGAANVGIVLPLGDPQTLIWTMAAWAFLPTSLIMRGVALWRVCDLIEEKRRRAYAQSDVLQPV
ncbi:hypothetical protein SAMN05421759_101248 [Roseivivax lentus]|uniref:Uncharacterized protein n=1 Tax=Roseivivax lentus TaxID=633194 RepID=A0A1N7JV42_9RHOB|nr:hypothetical protein [Roseivivax lentus]SIS53200.1 hypothetical protein SAMN05421759_101248 [Roseivivax lentus]